MWAERLWPVLVNSVYVYVYDYFSGRVVVVPLAVVDSTANQPMQGHCPHRPT